MSLSMNLYKAFEDVVGMENISDREYILAAYRHGGPGNQQKTISPEAVILPGSVEEIQAIIGLCNKHKIKYAGMVSLFSAGRGNQSGMVILDLKRMNKILEINEADRYAVIEPGVRHAQLKPELMKRGLSYPTASVGPAASVLANFITSGDHHVQHGTSRVNRYLLGTEWILPTGELLKLGSLGTGAGWSFADGPGPSLRGLLKGYAGWGGGLGIVTKIAIGLDDWKGPRVMPGEGHSPSYKVRLPPECHKVYIFKFPTLDKVRDAMIEMGKAEIGSAVLKYFYATEAVLTTESANDFWKVWESGLYQKELPLALWVYLATWSPEELAYEERVMWDIMGETGGEPVEESIRRKYDENADHLFIIVSFLQRVLRLGGGWAGIKLGADSPGHMFEVAKAVPEFFYEYIDKGLILNAPYNFQIIPMEYGHMAHIELLFFYDVTSPQSMRAVPEIMQKSQETDIRHGFHSSTPRGPKEVMERLGPLYSNFHLWQDKIKQTFDPNSVSR